MDEHPLVTGEIRNLSRNGAYFLADNQCTEFARVRLELEFLDDPTEGVIIKDDGKVEVDGQERYGTAVFFDRMDESDRIKIDNYIADQANAKRDTILIVEDSAAERTGLVRKISRALPYNTIEADDGQTGLARYEANSNTLVAVVSDNSMPNMNGLEMFQNIRAKDAKIPLVMASGDGPDVGGGVLELGNSYFVRKPYRAQKLVDTIKTAVETSYCRREELA